MQNWADLYTELSEKIVATLPNVEWVDLWHNQVNFLDEEHPFPSPAVFLNFRITGTEDRSLKVQQVTLQVDTYIFYETFSDTNKGSWNQESALNFLKLITDVYALLHGSSGDNYSEMRRTGFTPVDTGGAGNLYLQSFTCELVDYAAQKQYVDGTVSNVEVQNEKGPDLEESEPLFRIP